MKVKSIISASAVALAIGFAMPAAAQQTSGTSAGPTTGGIGVGNTATSNSTSTDLNLQDSGNNNSTNTDSRDQSNDDRDNFALASFNDNSDNSTDSRDQSNDDRDNFALGSFNNDWEDRSTNNSNNGNDSSSIVAMQILTATNANAAPLNFQSLALSDYSSGDNTVRDNAFAAYAGILNQAWNTGINANAQAATNVAARGTVTFGN
jgi:hypothetical protein